MMNFKISEFTKSEIAESRGIDNRPTPEVVDNIEELIYSVLQPLRDRWGSAIKISSGFRCEALNKAVKGSKTSQHKNGSAADIKACNGDNLGLFNLALEMIQNDEITVGQLIDEYDYSWVHISLPFNGKRNQILHLK